MEKVFLQACRGEQASHTPIWLNRQAGRYMPEYHQVRGDLPSLDFFKIQSAQLRPPWMPSEFLVSMPQSCSQICCLFWSPWA